MDRPGHVGQVEPSGLGSQRGVEHHLVQQIAQLTGQLVGPRSRLGVVGVDRLEHLVGLLEQEPLERVVGLLRLPGVAHPQPAQQRLEAGHVGRDRGGQPGDPQRGQVVRRHDAVEVLPGDLGDELVGQPEPLEDHDGFPGRVLDGQLDVGQDEERVALADQQRAALPRGLAVEAVTVDQTDPPLDGVHPEPRPGEVQERQGGMHHDLDAGIGDEQLDGVLGHHRRTRHRVDRRAVPRLGVDEPLDDLPVDVLDAICRLVHVVEVDGAVGHHRRRRVAPGPQEDGPTAVEQVPGPDGDQVRPRRSEPDQVQHRWTVRASRPGWPERAR